MLKTHPAVFAVEDTYQIMVSTTQPCLFWVRIGDEEHYDESNGILRSLSPLHRVIVPMAELNRLKEYTVCVRPLEERKPYFSKTLPVETYTYRFVPVPENHVRAYHIADAHNRVEEPVAAAKAFGDIDLLILNGDVINHSGDPEKFDVVYEICSRLTGGEKPVVFSRGNHDLRGNYAERFAEYTPNANGKTYYTVRLGSLWLVILDCGEDKEDDHAEYGHTVCCHAFRKRQMAFLQSLTTEKPYESDGVTRRLLICHNPFTRQDQPPFNIEAPLYTEWATLLREQIRPDLMICGHVHRLGIFRVGGEWDHLGQPCTLVTGSKPDEGYFAGCGFVFETDRTTVIFTDSNGDTLETSVVFNT